MSAKAWTIEELMEPGVRLCVEGHSPAPGWTVDLEVETTFDEVVDVRAPRPRAQTGASDKMRRCIIEAAWVIELTSNFNTERKLYPVTVS